MSGLGMAGGAVSAIGDIGGIFGAGQAANAMKDANNQLYQNALGQYNTDTTNLSPYMNMGSAYSNALTQQLPSLQQGFDPTMAQLQATPGYQFAQQQGQEATQNGFASRGLGVSGAALKGAANFATGLAQQTYSQDADIYNQNRSTTANILTGGAGMGLNAASTLGSLGNSLIGIDGDALTGAANAKAQGDMAPWQGISAAGSSISGMGGGSMGSFMGGGGSSSQIGNAYQQQSQGMYFP
jgi:hypothetical protein